MHVIQSVIKKLCTKILDMLYKLTQISVVLVYDHRRRMTRLVIWM